MLLLLEVSFLMHTHVGLKSTHLGFTLWIDPRRWIRRCKLSILHGVNVFKLQKRTHTHTHILHIR